MRAMQYFSVCAAGLMLLSACGSDPKTPNTSTNVAKPGTTAPAPVPTSPKSSGLKWTSEQLTTQSESCASRGSSSFSHDTWLKFCTCAYTEAAKKWSYDQFFNDFDVNYNSLFTAGAIDTCLSNAGIGNGN